LKGHLALHCTEVPLNVKTEFMELLARDVRKKNNSDESSAELDTDKKEKIDQALIRFFICCGIPFLVVNHPYFMDFVQSLCFKYNPPKRTTFSTTILNKEILYVLKKISDELKYEDNLTLGKIFIIFILN
jgi:hypothetical protein